MTLDITLLPNDLDALKVAVVAMHQRSVAADAARVTAEAEAARAIAINSSADALIAHLKLEIEKLRRELYGSRSERKARLLDQMELQLEDIEAAATEDCFAWYTHLGVCPECQETELWPAEASEVLN